MSESERPLASRAGHKLAAALDTFDISVDGATAADLGAATGGFVDVLLRRGARHVYAVEKGYGRLNWNLRNDSRVTVLERADATQVQLPEMCDIATIDVGFTRQTAILPSALELVGPGAPIVSLLKPQYEVSGRELERGKLTPRVVDAVIDRTLADLARLGLVPETITESTLRGSSGAVEFFLLLRRP